MKSNEAAKTNTLAMKIVYGGVLTALGVLMPQAFHMFGQNAGMIFLPMYFPILMAGILLGPLYGGIIGGLVPVLGCLLTGMPPVPKIYFMLIELIADGVLIGLMLRKTNIYVSILATMAVGRTLYGAALAIGVNLLHIHAPFANRTAFIGGVVSGIPGVALQLIVLPILYKALKKGGMTFEK